MGKGRKCWSLLILSKKMARDIFPKLFTEFPHLISQHKPTATETSPATPGGRLEACWANAPFLLTVAAIHSNSWCKKLKTKGGNSEIPSKTSSKNHNKQNCTKIHCVVGFLVSLTKSSHCEVCCQAFQTIQHSSASLRLQGVLTWLIPVSGFSLGRTAWNTFFGEVALVDEWWRHLKSFSLKKTRGFL